MPSASAGLRDRNERAILRALLGAGVRGTTRQELANAVGLSPAAVAKLVSGRIGHVLRSDVVTSGKSGPNPRALRIDAGTGCTMGIDFGQTYMGIGVFDLFGRALAEPEYTDFDTGAHADAAMSWMIGRARSLVARPEHLVGVGISIAAPVSGEPPMPRQDAFAMPDWRSRKPGAELKQALGWDCPFEVGNDADLGGLAELHWGIGRNLRDFVFVKWTWGIGAALVMDGRLVRGGGLAGELGHVLVELDDEHAAHPPEACPCCGRHCLQTVAAMPQMLTDAGVPGALERARLKPSVAELVAGVAAGDSKMTRALERACAYLGQALGAAVTLLNPQAVIIGGDLTGEDYALFHPPLQASLRRHTTAAAMEHVALYAGETTGRASLLGAAGWVLEEHLLEYLMRLAEPTR
jgi:predicted NBD/HSP70 family sugar kinase